MRISQNLHVSRGNICLCLLPFNHRPCHAKHIQSVQSRLWRKRKGICPITHNLNHACPVTDIYEDNLSQILHLLAHPITVIVEPTSSRLIWPQYFVLVLAPMSSIHHSTFLVLACCSSFAAIYITLNQSRYNFFKRKSLAKLSS